MPYDRIAAASPLDLAGIAFSMPLFSLVVAAVVTAMVRIIRPLRGHRREFASMRPSDSEALAAQYRQERLAIGIGAGVVIAAFAVEDIVRGYLVNLVDVVEWWRYATPVFAAALALTAVLMLIRFRGSIPPEEPVLSVGRRTWRSFSPKAGLLGAGITLTVLLTTTIAAGVESSADERGRYIYIDITIPNESIGPLRPWFYGWSFGVPILVCLAALVVVVWATLRANAIRPFRRPESVNAERAARVEVATGVARIATGGMLLALAGAWRFIGRSGSFSALTLVDGSRESYEASWRYSELAAVGALLAPVLEIAAFVLLLLVASRLRTTPARGPVAGPAEHESDPEAVR